MYRVSCVFGVALLAVAIPQRGALAPRQPSPACKPVIDATHRQSRTPRHVTVAQSGHPNTEVISLSDATYVKVPQGWVRTGPGFAEDRPDQEGDLPEVYECRRLPDATVDGLAASVFNLHTVRDTTVSDGTIRIARRPAGRSSQRAIRRRWAGRRMCRRPGATTTSTRRS